MLAQTTTSKPELTEVQVAAGILWKDGKFLACRRPAGKPLAGYWELPGGKLEPGETPLMALRRELREELGIEVEKARLWRVSRHEYSEHGIAVVLHFFQAAEFGGVVTGEENQELRWIRPEEYRGLDFLPADAEILRELAKYEGVNDSKQ